MSRLVTLLIAIAGANAVLMAVIIFLPSTIFSPNEYAGWRFAHAFRSDKPVSLVLGDSRARAGVRVDLLGERWRNLGLGGATAVEIKLFYDNHVDQWGGLDTVVIAFSAFHFEFPDTFERRALQYGQFSVPQILELRALAASPEFVDGGGQEFLDASARWPGYTLRLWPLYGAELREGWLSGGLRNPLYAFTVTRAQYLSLLAQYEGDGGWEARTGSIVDLAERRIPTAEGADEFRPSLLIERYLAELVARAAADARLVVLTSPPHSTLTAANPYADDYWSDVEALLCRIAGKHDDVVLMPLATYDERYFNDPSHMNVEGAALWTEEIAAFLSAPSDRCGELGAE